MPLFCKFDDLTSADRPSRASELSVLHSRRMTDADLLQGLGVGDAAAFLRHMRQTTHTGQRLSDAVPVGEPRAFPAASHCLSLACGSGWIAAGDAVCAFDPLAALGIGYALTSGIQAARIADAWFRGDHELAAAYPADIARHNAVYAAQSKHLYAAERRWETEPFWARRRG
jgi:2-polyprenyl-6-methoxyphenol hydroxylase-like FAD-dependent oxidoreductase